MISDATTVEAYLAALLEERKAPIEKLRQTILENLPEGFEEVIGYGMIGYVVPKRIFPQGYHCNPKLPLPYINIGSQKNHISLHHMGLYGSTKLLDWFIAEYNKQDVGKLDMGKGCVRFKKAENIPYKLIGELVKRVSVKDYIEHYEKALKRL